MTCFYWFQSIARLNAWVGGSDETPPSERRGVRLNVVSRAVSLNGTQRVGSGYEADGVQRHLQFGASADRNRTDRLVDAPPFHGHFHYNHLPQGGSSRDLIILHSMAKLTRPALTVLMNPKYSMLPLASSWLYLSQECSPEMPFFCSPRKTCSKPDDPCVPCALEYMPNQRFFMTCLNLSVLVSAKPNQRAFVLDSPQLWTLNFTLLC